MANPSNPFKTKEFKDLKKAWYKRLEERGFKDAETENNEYLKEWDSHYFHSRHEPTCFEIKQEYYYQATHFLLTGPFVSATEKEIWRLHVDGLSFREIAHKITLSHIAHSNYCQPTICDLFCPVLTANTKAAHIRFNKDKVNAIVRRLREAMQSHRGAVNGCKKKTSSG